MVVFFNSSLVTANLVMDSRYALHFLSLNASISCTAWRIVAFSIFSFPRNNSEEKSIGEYISAPSLCSNGMTFHNDTCTTCILYLTHFASKMHGTWYPLAYVLHALVTVTMHWWLCEVATSVCYLSVSTHTLYWTVCGRWTLSVSGIVVVVVVEFVKCDDCYE